MIPLRFSLSQIAFPVTLYVGTTKSPHTDKHAQEAVNRAAPDSDKVMRSAHRTDVRGLPVTEGWLLELFFRWVGGRP